MRIIIKRIKEIIRFDAKKAKWFSETFIIVSYFPNGVAIEREWHYNNGAV